MKLEKTKEGWRAIIRVVGPEGRIVERRAYAKTKEGVKAEAEKVKSMIRGGQPVSCSFSVSTFAELLSVYKEKKGQMSPSHNRKISFLEREIGSAPLLGFADRFEMWLKIEKQTARDKKGRSIRRGSSPAKCNRLIEIARAAFNIGVAVGIVNRNPITKERFPKQREIARDAELTPEQEEQLLKIIDEERPHLSYIVRFALQVPCRKSELVNLKVEDVDLINERIRIRNANSKTQRGTFKPIPPNLLQYFRTLPKDTQYVFFRRDENGIPQPLGDFRRSWKYCLEKIDLSGMRFHDTRHISATRMIDNGTPSQAVQAIAGWSTDMLKTYYAREPGHALEQVKWSRSDQSDEGSMKEQKGNV